MLWTDSVRSSVGWSERFAGPFDAGHESLRWVLLVHAPTDFGVAWNLWTSVASIREDEASAVGGVGFESGG